MLFLGRQLESMGSKRDQYWFCGGTIFFDSGPSKIFFRHQSSLDTETTLQPKYAFKKTVPLTGVIIQDHCADNQILNSNFFRILILRGKRSPFAAPVPIIRMGVPNVLSIPLYYGHAP